MESEPTPPVPSLNDILELQRLVDLKGSGEKVHQLKARVAILKGNYAEWSVDSEGQKDIIRLVSAIRADLQK